MTIQEAPSVAPYPPPALEQKHLSDAALYADRIEALSCWPKNARVAEIGVAYGAYTSKVLELTQPKLFDAYDLFKLHELESLWGQPTTEIFENKKHLDYYRGRFADSIAAGRLRTFVGDGADNIRKQGASAYDVIYIDGNHGYPGVLRDALAAVSVLAPDGMIVFNDYVLYDKTGGKYGIVPVVNHMCLHQGWKVRYFALNREMFCDIGIVKG